MSTTLTNLETIRSRVATKLEEQLPAVLLYKAVAFHCRRHNINSWCDCDFCNKKREASMSIAFAPRFPSINWRRGAAQPYWSHGYWELVNERKEWRNAERTRYRKELNELKNVI